MKNKIGIGMLLICLFVSSIPVTAATKTSHIKNTEIYEISSIEEFQAFAKKCQDAGWSEGKKVHLKKDLSFKKESFIDIPYFAGYFDGEGHTISEIRMKANRSGSGVFAKTASDAFICNLRVEGTIRPGGSQEKIGGIVGENAGKIYNCVFQGKISADNETGGIAGHNQSSGRITSCCAIGSIEGIADIGGITGMNEGLLRNCKNQALVNASQHEESVSQDQITAIFEHISTTGEVNSLRNTANITDIGGVAGLNRGKIEKCTNIGTVGYQYVGYNIGGIAGCSSGFISDCDNKGDVYGRKDAGGIAGQLQPYLEIEFGQDEIETLQEELGKLNDMVYSAGEDTKSYSAQMTDKLNQLSDLLSKAQNSANAIVDGGLSYADALTDQTNLNLSQIKKSVKELSDIMKELQDGIDQMEQSADTLVDETENFIDETKMSKEDKESAGNAIRALQTAMNEIAVNGDQLMEGMKKISTDLDTLQYDIDHSGWSVQKAAQYTRLLLEDVKLITKYTGEISKSLNKELIPAVNGISELVEKYALAVSKEAEEFKVVLDRFSKAETAVGENLTKMTEHLNTIIGLIDTNNQAESYANILAELQSDSMSTDMDAFQDSLTELNKATGDLNDAISELIGSAILTEEDEKLLTQYNDTIQKASNDIARNGSDLQVAVDKLVWDLDLVQSDIEQNLDSLTGIKNDILMLKDDCDTILEYAANITTIINSQVIPAMNVLSSLLIKYGEGPDNTELRNAIRDMMDSVTNMPQTLDQLSKLLDTLDKKLEVEIPKLEDATRESKESLYESMLEAGDQVKEIVNEAGKDTDGLTTDLQEVANQFNDCMNLLMDAVQDLQSTDTNPMEHVEDLSQRELTEDEIASLKQGRVTGSRNNGDVTGSLNLGGIIGTVGIESDLDPEKDIASAGNSSRNYAFQSKCIIDQCVNDGNVYARKNNLGGIVGLMNLGLVTQCESYGDLSSENGSYIGGLAGYSQSAVRNSFARGSLSGLRYIGGAVGYGFIISNVDTMVCIPQAEQEYGAIAGAVSDLDASHLYGNRFVAEKRIDSEYRTEELFGAQAGIGGVSYPQMAEKISYQKLLKKESIPKRFRTMTLIFQAEDQVVKVIDCQYGTDLSEKSIPEVPSKEGYSGEWDREDYKNIAGNDTIRAVYSVAILTLSSEETRGGKQSVLLVDGSFGKKAKFTVSPADLQKEELERWQVSLSDKGSHKYRFLPTENEVSLFLEKDGKQTELKTSSYGKYLIFTEEEPEFVLVVKEKEKKAAYYWLFIPLLIAAVAIVAARKKSGPFHFKKILKKKKAN